MRSEDTRHDRRAATSPAGARRAQPAPARLGNHALARLASAAAPAAARESLQAGNAATASLVARCRDKKKKGKGEEKKPNKWKVKTTGTAVEGPVVPRDYVQFLVAPCTVYLRSKHPPAKIFQDGFSRREGYDDIVKHTTVDQGYGSNWIGTASTPVIQENYGRYLYEVALDGTRGIDVNTAYSKIEKGKSNPFFWQEEIAVYKRIPPEQVVAVWDKRDVPLPTVDGAVDDTQYFLATNERLTPDEALVHKWK